MENRIAYKLKRSKRAKRMRLAVYCDGRVVITSPFGVERSVVEKFLTQKSQWVADKLEYFKGFSGRLFVGGGKKDYKKYKGQALALAQKQVDYFSKIYGFKYNKINIKNQKTRWGSCSKKGNLNFNYKIALLSERLADYIICHELCHLKEFNHSRKFWNLLSKAVPDYLEMRKELRNKKSKN